MAEKKMRQDEELKKSQQKYRDLFENSVVGMFRSNLDGSALLEINQALCDQSGYSREELLSEPSYIRWADPGTRDEMVKQLKKFGSVVNFEADFITKNGKIKHALFSAKLYPEEGYLEGTIIDITDRKLAEEALRKASDFNEDLIQASPAFFVAISPEGKTLMMNEAMLQALGYTLEEVAGKDYLTTFVPESDREMLSAVFQTLALAKEPTLNENYLLTRDGRHLLVEWRGRFVFKEKGELEFYFGVGNDITERKQAEADLLESKEFIRGITDNIPGAVCQFYARDNGEMGIHYVSGHTAELLGLDIEPLNDFFQRFVACVAPEDKECFQASIQAAVQNMSNWDHEVRFIKSNGEDIYIRGISKPRQIENEIVFDGVLLDITRRRQALKALEESEKRFRDLTENTTDWIWEMDNRFCTVYSSPGVLDIIGYNPEEILGSKMTEFLAADEAARIQAIMDQMILDPQPWRNIEYTIPHKNGSLRILESSGIPLFDADGRWVGYRGIDRDVTERKRTEQLLKLYHERFIAAFYDSPAPMVITEASSGKTFDVNKACVTWAGYSLEETIGRTGVELGFISEFERNRFAREIFEKGFVDSREIKFRTRNGGIRDILHSAKLIEIDNMLCILSHLHDVTDQRRAEEELKKHRDHLEELVQERTEELSQANEKLRQENEVRRAAEVELDKRQKDLEQMNAALKVLLRQREEDRDKIEKDIMSNLHVSILPYLDKLDVAPLNATQKSYLNIIKSNLDTITSSFVRTISSEYVGFTAKEIQIASLIKDGKTSKEISELLNVSLNTVHTYRNRIRAKSGLKNKKVDLRSHLKIWK